MQKGFYLDLTRCTSCYACVVACKAHHANSEEGVFRRRVLTLESGVYPEVRLANLSLSCMHCATPACGDVCPMHAIQKRAEDGLVLINPDLCIGCKMCLVACPFGIPQFGKKGKMEKCDFCVERLEKGLNPACVDVCPARALHAGPMDQLSSLAARKATKRLVRSTGLLFSFDRLWDGRWKRILPCPMDGALAMSESHGSRMNRFVKTREDTL